MKSSQTARTVAFACVFTVVLFGLRALGQAPRAALPNQKDGATTLRVTTRTIQVSVIASDKDGQPVSGLKKSDFTLLDGGQEQKISYFAEQATQEARPGTNLDTTSARTSNTFSNRMDQKVGAPTSATVILLDLRDTEFKDIALAKKQVTKFLGQLQPQDRVALYTLSSKLYIVHDFTENTSSLLQALQGDGDSYNFRLGAAELAPSDTSDANFDSAVDAANGRAAEFDTNNRAAQTALAIKTIADHLKGLTGRKNLIWVTASFPLNILTSEVPTPQSGGLANMVSGPGTDAPLAAPLMGVVSNKEQIEFAARALISANVAVYPVDAGGLIGNPIGVDKPGAFGRPGATPEDTTSPFPDRSNVDTMNTIAERTGGRAFYNNNDIKGALRKAIDDSRDVYVLGYYPANTNWDGKFREIKIRTNIPGVRLRYRLGYYALPDLAASEKRNEELMSDAKWSPLEATDLGIEASVDPVNASGVREIKVQLRIASNQLHFEFRDNRWSDNLEVIWVEIGPTGKSLGQLKRTVGLDVPQESYDLLVSKGINFSQTLRPGPNASELRLVVRDGGSGAIGSVNIPLAQIFEKMSRPTTTPKN